MPRVGVHDKQKVGGWTVELSYSADEGNWAVTVSHEDGRGHQYRGGEANMRSRFAGFVEGLTLQAKRAECGYCKSCPVCKGAA